MNVNTAISSKKYKTIGELLNAPIKSIVQVSINEKNDDVKKYLYEWLYDNHYSKLNMSGNLTMRIKNISNQPCYNYIMQNCFNNADFYNKLKKNILNETCLNFIKQLHVIQPSLTGVYLDYLLRRIICEIVDKPFYDNRTEGILNCCMHEFVNLPISIDECYIKTKDTNLYKTYDILLEIFITSLSHTLSFSSFLDTNKVSEIINLIETTIDIKNILVNSLKNLCYKLLRHNAINDPEQKIYTFNDEEVETIREDEVGAYIRVDEIYHTGRNKELITYYKMLKKNEINILLNPTLGYKIPEINNKRIPADCDLIINNTLYDIKCTIGENSIYEILQLMGYASLINCNNLFTKKINYISVINCLQGYITTYDISNITNEQMINYLKILTR
jgi:hypothetical protein